MACSDDRTLVMFADDELDAFERSAVEQHVAGCTSCRAFVAEMRSLATLGRSSLRKVTVPTRPSNPAPVSRLGATPRLIALASLAAIVLIAASVGWLVIRQAAPREVPFVAGEVAQREVAQPPAVTPLADEAFERWSAQYRQLRIPLIPMEDVPKYISPPIRPAGPLPSELDLKS